MFVIATILDTIRIPPNLLSTPTIQAIHSEIDQRFPNRVLLDVGLVISRYGDHVEVGNGVCVAGDGGSHHECKFRVIVFRPFVEEVCVGRIIKSTADGVHVSLGFFEDIFIPAYWMLRPSVFEASTELWVWTPKYDDDEEGDDEQETKLAAVELQPPDAVVKTEVTDATTAENNSQPDSPVAETTIATDVEETRYEMELGSEIRFRVKSINFTQITNTAKGMQATTTSTTANYNANSNSATASKRKASDDGQQQQPSVRQRSSSFGLEESAQRPPVMQIVASICEDGLGLTSWWTSGDDEDETAEPEISTEDVEPMISQSQLHEATVMNGSNGTHSRIPVKKEEDEL
jgi:DNA-directed RNA polymerase III subunit RPC8